MDSMDVVDGEGFVTMDSFVDGPFHDNGDQSFSQHMEFPDGSVPTIAKASSGRMSPVRSKTVKEFYEQLSELKKENFSLKLRIFYMEERMNSNKEYTKDEYCTANINLKIEVESLKKELSDKADLLKKASTAMDHLSVQHQEELDEIQARTEQDRQQMTEVVQKEVAERNVELMRQKDETIACLSRDLDVLRGNVQMLEKQKQDTLTELNQRVEQLQNQLPDRGDTENQEKLDLLEIIEEQRQKSSELEVVLEQLSEELAQKDHVIQTVQSESEKLKEKYDQVKKKAKQVDKMEGASLEKDAHISNLEDTLTELRATLDDRDKRCKELNNHVTQMESHVTGLKSRICELESTASQNENDLLVRAKAIQGLTQEAHARGKQNTKLCDRVEELERELTDLQADLHTHKMSKYDQESSAQKDLLEAENYVQKLRDQISKLQQDLRNAQGILNEKDAKIHEVSSELEIVKNRSKQLELAHRSAQKNLSEAENTVQKLRVQVSDLQEDLCKAQGDLNAKDAKMNEINSELNFVKNRAKELEHHSNNQRRNSMKLEDDLRGILNRKDAKINEIESELETIKNTDLKDFPEQQKFISKLQEEMRKTKTLLTEKDNRIAAIESELELVKVHAEELEKYSSEKEQALEEKVKEREEGLKSLVEKYENEKLALRQQIRVVQADIQHKDKHAKVIHDLRAKVDHLLQVTESNNNDTVLESLRFEIKSLSERLPCSPCKDSPMACTAAAPGPQAAQHQRQLQDPHMSLAGPMTASTPLTPPRGTKAPPPYEGHYNAMAHAPPPHGNAANHTTPVYPAGETTLRPQPPLRPALVGSANPDAGDQYDVTDYRPLAQSEHLNVALSHSFIERLNTMGEADLRQEIVQLSHQLKNAKEMCSNLQERVDQIVEGQLVNSEERHRHSPNRASEIIKRLKFELENSKTRLKELERLNSVLMESGDFDVNTLRSELAITSAKLQDQRKVLSKKEVQLTQVTFLVNQVKTDLATLENQVAESQLRTTVSDVTETEEFCHSIQTQLADLRRCIQDKCAEFQKAQNSPNKYPSSKTPDLAWDSRDLFYENQVLREKLGMTHDDDLESAPSINEVTNRLVQLTDQLNKMRSEESKMRAECENEIRSLNSSRDNMNTSRDNTSEVDRLCDEILALRQENENLATRCRNMANSSPEFEEIPTPQRVSEEDLLKRHQRQIETLKRELDTERQHNRSLMDVINAKTPNASFLVGQGIVPEAELRRAAILKNAGEFGAQAHDGFNTYHQQRMSSPVAASPRPYDVTTQQSDVTDSSDVVARLDEVCRLLNEILVRQEDLSDHVTMTSERGTVTSSRVADHVTGEYLRELKRKLSTMVSMVQVAATTMNESLSSATDPDSPHKDHAHSRDSSHLHQTTFKEQLSLADSKNAILQHQINELERKYSDLELKSTECEKRAEMSDHKCQEKVVECVDLKQMQKLSEQKCLELERKCSELDARYKDAMRDREVEIERVDELEMVLETLKGQNENLNDELNASIRLQSELQHRVRELEEELGRSVDDNQTLRNDVIMTQDLLNQTKQNLDKRSEENGKLKGKLKKNDETIKQCTEALNSVRTMVQEKSDMIRLLKDKCKRLQRAKPRSQASQGGATSTASEDDDAARRPPRRRKSRSKNASRNDDVIIDNDVMSEELQERLRHHTGSSQSLVNEDRVLSPATGSDVMKSPSPCANFPLGSDQSESLYENQSNLDLRSINMSGILTPANEVERLKQRLQATENMNETLKAELMLYQHLSQTLTSSLGSTPHNSKSDNLAQKFENVSLHECSIGSWTNISPSKNVRPSSAPTKRLSTEPPGPPAEGSDRSLGSSMITSELAQHLLELRRLRERLEGTIALNDDLTKQLNQQLRERGGSSDDVDVGVVTSLRHQVEALRQDLTDTQGQLEGMAEEAESFRSEAERAQLECQNLNAQMRRHAQDEELLREDLNRLTQENNRSRSEISKVKEEHLRTKENCNRLESERNRLKEQCNRLRGDCERLRSEVERKDVRDDEESKVRTEVARLKGRNSELDLSALVEEIARLRVQLERSISTNQALRNKLEEIIQRGGSDSLSASLKKLLRQSEPVVPNDDVIERPSSRRGSQNGRSREVNNVVDQAYHYPPDSSDSGTCTGNRSLSNSHSSLPPMNRSRDDVIVGGRQSADPITSMNRDFPGLRRAASALSLSGSQASSRDDVIQHCDVLNDDEHILSVSMLEEEQRRRDMPDFDLETRDDYLLLPPGGRASLHALQTRPKGTRSGLLGTRSVDDLRHVGGSSGRTSPFDGRQYHSQMRINSDLRFLFAIGRLDDYELAKKQMGECQVILRGVAARVQDRLQAYHGTSLVQRGKSAEYTTLREVSTSVDNLLHCIHQASGLLYQFWTSQLPPRDHHGNYVDPEMQRENEELRSQLRRLKSKYQNALQTMKSAQKRLHKANKRKEDMEEAIYRQLSQTEKVVRQARINMEVKTGVTATDVLTRHQTDA